MKSLLIIFLALGCLVSNTLGQAPSPSGHPGILLFQQGKFAEAARLFEIASKSTQYKNDAEIWSYMGLAYLSLGDTKKSVKTLEKSVALNGSDADFRANLAYAHLMNGDAKKAREQADKALDIDGKNATAFQVRATVNLWERKLEEAGRDADAFISLDPKNARGYILKSNVLMAHPTSNSVPGKQPPHEASLLKDAVDVLESGRLKAVESPALKELERELENLTAFSIPSPRIASRSTDTTAVGPGPTITPFRILNKPAAQYSTAARNAGVEGSISVKLILASDGTVSRVLFLSRLGYGLEENVLDAARRIKFEPKRIDGKPVSAVVRLEYKFSIY